jgi:hypothetical protein
MSTQEQVIEQLEAQLARVRSGESPSGHSVRETTMQEPKEVFEELLGFAPSAQAEAYVIDVWNAALEAAARVVDQCNRDGPYQAIGAARLIRNLKL